MVVLRSQRSKNNLIKNLKIKRYLIKKPYQESKKGTLS